MSIPIYNKDILSLTLTNLTYEDIQNFKVINKHFNHLIPTLYIWKKIAKRDFLKPDLTTYSLYRSHYNDISNPKKYKFGIVFSLYSMRQRPIMYFGIEIPPHFIIHQVDNDYVIQTLRDVDFKGRFMESEIEQQLLDNKPVSFNIILGITDKTNNYFLQFAKQANALIDLKIGEEKVYDSQLDNNITLKFHIARTIYGKSENGSLFEIMFPTLIINTAMLRQFIVNGYGKGGITEID
jgi:hypothetical protein